MIDDLDRALRNLLTDELPRVVERIEADGFDVAFEVPNRETTARLTRPTLNLFLYHVQENRELRPPPWETTRVNGRFHDARPPVSVDCSYLVTAWSNEVEDEHRLLTGAARVFFRHFSLPHEWLEGSLPENHEIRMMVSPPGAMQDVIDIWSVLDNDLRPSVRVTVTLPLELDVTREGPLVTERQIEIKAENAFLPVGRRVAVAGRLVREGDPIAGAYIRMDRASGETRIDGTFDLRGVAAGTTTALVVVEGEMLRFSADPPVGELPDGELLAFDLADAVREDDSANGTNGSNGGDSAAADD